MGFKIFGVIAIVLGLSKLSWELVRLFDLYHQAILFLIIVVVFSIGLILAAMLGSQFLLEKNIDPRLLILFSIGVIVVYLIGMVAAFFN